MNEKYIYIKQLTLDAAFIATSVVLAMLIHSIGGKPAGAMWVPMWWGAFLSGLILGPIHGLVVGLLTPLISFVVRGVPPYPFWLIFAIEIAIYGFMWGSTYALLKKGLGNNVINFYISAFIGFILGKLAAALVLMFVIPSLVPKMAAGIGAAFWMVLAIWTIKSLPGILLLLIVGPVVVNYLVNIIGGNNRD